MDNYVAGLGIVPVPEDEAAQIQAEWDAANDPAVKLEAARASATLSRMEFFTALESIGLFDTVWAMQDDETVPKLTRIMIRTASSFDRMHPELIEMAGAMGITEEQLDELFGIEVPQ